jgi:hypothetical protein
METDQLLAKTTEHAKLTNRSIVRILPIEAEEDGDHHHIDTAGSGRNNEWLLSSPAVQEEDWI